MKAIITIEPEVTVDMHAMLNAYLTAAVSGWHEIVATSNTTVEVEFDEHDEKNSDIILQAAGHVGNIFGCGPRIRFV